MANSLSTAGLPTACIGHVPSSAVSEPVAVNNDEAGANTQAAADAAGTSGAETSSNAAPGAPHGEHLELFLLIGQSNMEGVPKPEPEDLVEHPRIYVLGYDECEGRAWNRWAIAKPPLHRCWAGVGPADSFARVMVDAMPRATIGLIPTALSGVDIDLFRKGVVSKRRNEFEIPPDNQRQGAYDMVVERARLAQRSGTIRGILFHQGESDTGNAEWVNKVAELVSDLRADLKLPESVPFVAGELPYGGCCASHNVLVNRLPSVISNAHVVSAEGLELMDQYHFDLKGMRTLGQRYAEKMREVLGI